MYVIIFKHTSVHVHVKWQNNNKLHVYWLTISDTLLVSKVGDDDNDEEAVEEDRWAVVSVLVWPRGRRGGGGTAAWLKEDTMDAELDDNDERDKLSFPSLSPWREEEAMFREEEWGFGLLGMSPGQAVVPWSSCLSVSEYLLARSSVLSASKLASYM